MSPSSAGLAAKMGYSNIKVMLQGVPGWKKSGRPLFASTDFVKNGNIVLIDLRAREVAAAGHIPRAVSIPLTELEEAADDFPAMRSQAPIVLYGSEAEVRKGAGIIKEWGYPTIAAVNGGFEGWQAAGNPVVKGSIGSEITWKYKPGKGEVGIDEFKKVLAGKEGGKVILDVRGKEEVSEGMFAGAINIPLDEVEKRIGDLPEGKEFLAHCSTGARADMAVQSLLKAGLKARFLVANIVCEDGECEIEE
ncbi:MAG: rhodanese-like domain-containing protein [Desulfurivibrionaceae bacterium]|nr:rhodanese-like domain-containing protein [Desulfurivibrionaceae bacterium]